MALKTWIDGGPLPSLVTDDDPTADVPMDVDAFIAADRSAP